MRRISPAVVLFFVSPLIAELLSGSAPPVEFFNPVMILVLTALYGSGAILIRERSLQWKKRWPTILVLGLAYGIVEEGLMIKSFFDPAWPDLGSLAIYGRWGGVNWVWSVMLTLYHAVFSVAIPIMLVEMLFPERRDEHWIGRRGMIGLGVLLAADVLFGLLVLTSYEPPLIPYLGSIVTVVAIYLVAKRLPVRWKTPRESRVPRPFWFGLLGFVATLSFFVMLYIFPEIQLPVVLTISTPILLASLVLWTTRRLSRDGKWDDEHRLALISGALAFFILLAPLQELDTTRVDDTSGMTIVGLGAAIFLLWLRRRVRLRPPQVVTFPYS